MASAVMGLLRGFTGAPISLTPEHEEGVFGEALEASIIFRCSQQTVNFARHTAFRPKTGCLIFKGVPSGGAGARRDDRALAEGGRPGSAGPVLAPQGSKYNASVACNLTEFILLTNPKV